MSGAKSPCSSGLLAQLNVDELENVSTQEIADAINSALPEPLEEYRLPSAPCLWLTYSITTLQISLTRAVRSNSFSVLLPSTQV